MDMKIADWLDKVTADFPSYTLLSRDIGSGYLPFRYPPSGILRGSPRRWDWQAVTKT